MKRKILIFLMMLGLPSYYMAQYCSYLVGPCAGTIAYPCTYIEYTFQPESACAGACKNCGKGTYTIVAGGAVSVGGTSYPAGTVIIPSAAVDNQYLSVKIMFLESNKNYILSWQAPNSGNCPGCSMGQTYTYTLTSSCQSCSGSGGGTGNNTSTCELDVFCQQASYGYCQNTPYNFKPKTPDCSGCNLCGPGTYVIVANSTFTVGGVNYAAGTHTIPNWMVSGIDLGITVTFTDDYQPYIIYWTPPICSSNCVQTQQSYSLFTGCDQNACNGSGPGGSTLDNCQLSANFSFSGQFCGTNNYVDFSDLSNDLSDNIVSYQWDFGDNTTDTQPFPSHNYSTPGDYLVSLIIENDHVPNACRDTIVRSLTIDSICDLPCTSCIGSFSPTPNKKYVLSAWAQEKVTSVIRPLTYTKPKISVVFTNSAGALTTAGPFTPKGQLIDEWQRIEEEFFIPQDAVNIQLKLESSSGDVYFDDIRIFPFDGSMKSFVYDPVSLRFVAELDERNYATFYEYNEEGSLVRTKKETEKGVMTIQESRSNIKK